ncbi:MAG: hypothetical protein AAF494_00240 [Pseudomonadota bacterium]
MTIHFAPAHLSGRLARCNSLSRGLEATAAQRFANDNDTAEPVAGSMTGPSNDVLKAALRHFAKHGMNAARHARNHAETAFFAGDRPGYDWWIAVTRTLDRRLAAEAHRRTLGRDERGPVRTQRPLQPA